MINNLFGLQAMAVRNHTLILFIFGFSLFGCNTNLSISQQLTSYNVGCETKDVKIFDEIHQLNGDVTWTAECKGKTYSCAYHDTAGTECHEIFE